LTKGKRNCEKNDNNNTHHHTCNLFHIGTSLNRVQGVKGSRILGNQGSRGQGG
jgi:hypothetical protein